jgi:hypothetical protein
MAKGYHNIEERKIKTVYPAAKYRGWDSAGRFYYVGKGGARGDLWWARERTESSDWKQFYGATLAEISAKLEAQK